MAGGNGNGAGAPSALIRRTAERCAGENLYVSEEVAPVFVWLHGSALVELRELGDHAADFNAVLLLGPVRTKGLVEALSERTSRLRVGRLAVDEDGDVVLRHRFRTVDSPVAFERDLVELCRAAADLGDELQCSFGGQLSSERFLDEVLFALGRCEGRPDSGRPRAADA